MYQFSLLIRVGLLLLVAGATAGDEPAGSAALYGVVTRPAAQHDSRSTVNRYRTRAVPAAESGDIDNCNCNPGLYSVVYLTGDNLPPAVPLDTVPEMSQIDKRFEPAILAVTVGSRVSFPNLDPFYHNVFSYSKTRKFDLGRYPQGETKLVEFDRPGIAQIFCEIHYSMRAYVHVLETPYFAVSNEQGKFDIPHIVPGDYTIHVWQENLPELSQPIRIGPDSNYVELR